MADKARALTRPELEKLHTASLAILDRHGVAIKDDGIVDFFKKRGFRTDGYKIRFSESEVTKALETAPERFTIRAVNPAHSLEIGGPEPALSGTGGPPMIIDPDGTMRTGTLDDYRKFCKLIQTSALPQIVPGDMVQPADIPARTSHLDMFFAEVTLCDRPLTGNTLDETTTEDSLEFLSLFFGGRDGLKESPASINIINPLSPLQYAPDQAKSLMLLAGHNQAVALTNMILMGSTAPVDLASALALGNAELLAGVVLSQLVRPGAPVVYGSTSCPMEMKAGLASLAKPETLLYSQATIELARYYRLPARTGGALTDSHLVDAQAGFESALLLKNAIDQGVDYILHAFGMVRSYMAASLEKWVIDEELCRIIMASRRAAMFDPDSINVDFILKMGCESNYLTSPEVFKNFRSMYQSGFIGTQSHSAWREKGAKDSLALARDEVARRLAAHQAPALDEGLLRELKSFVDRRKKELLP